MSRKTLVQAQQKYIDRVLACHPGHRRRVRRSAWHELSAWARSRGLDPADICRDADDMAKLELDSED